MLKGRLDTTTGAGTYQVVVHLERDVLDPKGFEARLSDGTPLHPETFRRIACDASLIPGLFDEQGRVLDVGRKTRAIPTAIRRALEMRDRHCALPGCDSRRWLHGHHITPWHAGGETRLDNLVLLCGFHHRLVHEQRYGVRLLPSGKAAFYYPSGVRIAPVPRRPHAPRDARGSAAGSPPDVTPRDVPDWDGRQPDYDACVAALQSA